MENKVHLLVGKWILITPSFHTTLAEELKEEQKSNTVFDAPIGKDN